jgi:hypothetical protein
MQTSTAVRLPCPGFISADHMPYIGLAAKTIFDRMSFPELMKGHRAFERNLCDSSVKAVTAGEALSG